MEILNNIMRYIYRLSLIEVLVYSVFITWVYLKIRELIINKSKTAWKIINVVGLVLFTLVVLYRVVLSRNVGSVQSEINLIPLSSYYNYFVSDYSEAFFTNKANVLLFYPFGLLLFDYLKTRKSVVIYIVIAFVFSLSMEIAQYVFSLGFAEVDDVIHNTLGAFLGYLACIYIPKIQISIKK